VRGALAVLIAALCMLAASPSHAHRISTRSGPPPEGVSIPNLTHGQMVVIRDNLPAIWALASARLGFDSGGSFPAASRMRKVPLR
jgi:hypothetical protein